MRQYICSQATHFIAQFFAWEHFDRVLIPDAVAHRKVVEPHQAVVPLLSEEAEGLAEVGQVADRAFIVLPPHRSTVSRLTGRKP